MSEENIIEGKNAVIEAIRAGRPLDKIFLVRGSRDKALGFIASNARNAGITVTECDRRKLDAMSATNGAHQGVVAVAAAREYCAVEDILALAQERGEDPFVVVCDGLEDPRNLGAVIRTAECAGAHGVIIPRHHSAGITAAADKASAGAAEHMLIARVANLTGTLQELKKAGLWVYGAEANGESALWHTDMKGPVCLVIGSEGQGLSRLVRENCDFVMTIPMAGRVNSLNASVAAALLLYEVVRQRHE
ncbi:MAG: 23S rRNA (guanosine(2251)-2'-O)-methyltransferase RlmB [Oscillospiraceae bacterium]